MDNDKNLDYEGAGTSKEDSSMDSAPRARNRTVMLTPEITGQVRARLAQELEQGGPPKPEQASGGFGGSADRREASAFGGTPAGFTPPGSGFGGVPDGGRARMTEDVAAAPRAKSAQSGEGVFWTKPTKIVGFLVSYDKNPNGDVFELRTGRFIVTSEVAGTGNHIVIVDPSVSPMHAIVRVSDNGEVQVLDQLSEFGTTIKSYGSSKQEQLSGDKGSLEHGDIVHFGKRTFNVCILAGLKDT